MLYCQNHLLQNHKLDFSSISTFPSQSKILLATPGVPAHYENTMPHCFQLDFLTFDTIEKIDFDSHYWTYLP